MVQGVKETTVHTRILLHTCILLQQSYKVGIQTQGGSYGLWQYRINMHKLLVEEKA